MRRFIVALSLLAAAACPALAEIERTRAEGSVPEAMDRLEAAVEGAGATIFARVDHGAGAAEAGMELPDSQLLIFGNPQLGTPAMQADMLAGLHLPLKILVYADEEGQTWVAYEEIEATFGDLDIDDDAEFVGKMQGALETFAGAAVGN